MPTPETPFSPRFARRIRALVQSDIRRMSRECERLGGINLGQGICDQPTPEPIKKATQTAVRDDRNMYSKFEGIDDLRARIAGKMAAYNGIRCDPGTDIVVTVGSTGAFACAALALLDPGDEVILFSPFYSYHLNLIALCGATPRYVKMRPPRWDFDEAEIRAAFSDRTRMIIVNTPSNPTGKVFREEELRCLAELCGHWGALAVTDEIYEYILYDGHRHLSLGALPGMEDRTVTISGFSKTYSMTGWRLGYAVADRRIASRLGVLNDLLYICAPTPLQHGVTAAFDLPASYYEALRSDYALKLEALSGACEAAGLGVIRPQGAYYLLADVEGLGCASDREAAERLLDRAGVTAIPGGAFHADPEDGRHQVRFCFAKKPAELDEACRRLRALRL